MPVVLVKWKVFNDGGSKVLIIDNCGVLPEYRRRGLAKRTVNEILQLCTAVTEVHSVMMFLPANLWMLEKSSSAQHCRLLKYSDLSGVAPSSWKQYACIWIPQQSGIAMNRV